MNRLKLALTALMTAALVVASLPLSASANAQTTSFPPLITNTLTVQHGNRSADVTTTYIQYALDRLQQSASSSYRSKEDFQRDYRRALNEGTWGLIQHHYKRDNGDDVKSITYFFNFSTACDMKLAYDALSSDNYTYTLAPSVPVRDECRFRTVSFSGYDDRVYYNKSTASSMVVVQAVPRPRQQGARLFLYSGDYTLHQSAQGITGELPRTAPTGDTVLRVNFKYSHVFTDIRARYTGLTRHESGVSADNIPDPAKIRWYLIKHFDSAKDDPETWNQAALASWSKLDDYNNSDYALRTGDTIPALRVEDLMSGDSRPPMYVCSAVTSASDEFTTDACNYRPYNPSGTARKDIKHEKYVLTAIPHEGAYSPEHNVIFRYTLAKLDLSTSVEAAFTDSCNAIRDGSNGNDRECKEYSDYQDCSLLDVLDVVGRIGCHISNFGVALKNMIKFLFVPNPLSVSDSFNSMLENMKRSFGFLALPFTLVPNLFGMILQGAGIGPNCALPPLTVFGATATIELCAWRHQLPAVWSFMQLVVQAGISLGFLWVAYSLLMQFFGVRISEYEEEADDEEVVELHPDVSRHKTDYVKGKGGKRLW